MKFLFSITLFFLALSIKAQNVSYSVECPKPDSCFLKEVSVGAPTSQEPRPQATTSYRYFKTLEEFDEVVNNIRKQASEELAKGMEIVDRARSMNLIADKIQGVRPKTLKQ